MSFFRRAMVYLGLVDDDYDDYEPYDDTQPVAPARQARPQPVPAGYATEPDQMGGAIRTLPREPAMAEGLGPVAVTPRPAVVRGTLDRSKFPDAGGVRLSSTARSFLQFKSRLDDDQSTFELR